MSWLSRDSSSHGAHIAATAVISGIVVAATIFGAQAVRRQLKVDHLKRSIPGLDEEHEVGQVNLQLSWACQRKKARLTRGSEAYRVWHCVTNDRVEQGR